MTTIEPTPAPILPEAPEVQDPLQAMAIAVDDRLQEFVATGKTVAPDRRVPLLDIDGDALAAQPDLPEQFAAAYKARSIGSLSRALDDLRHFEWESYTDPKGRESLFRVAYFSTYGCTAWLKETYTGTKLGTPEAVRTGYSLQLEQARKSDGQV